MLPFRYACPFQRQHELEDRLDGLMKIEVRDPLRGAPLVVLR